MKPFDKPFKDFEHENLSKLNFGNLEGEKDVMLEESFLQTASISRIFNLKYNYVLSPKGGGKSAVFRIIKNKLVSKDIFDYEKYSIIGISSAFGFEEEDYLKSDNFKEEEHRKNYIISWGIYLIHELINDIIENHNDKSGHGEFCDEIRKIVDLKGKYELYELKDYINNVNFSLNFNVQGQDFSFNPKLGIDANTKKLSLNKIFTLINNFYKTNSITAVILIDRLDNFVRKESYELQKNYIQGLIDCIEELSNFGNIKPILLIRTDLYYAFDVDFEYDKVKERTKELIWSDAEILGLIVYRLLANKHIKDNYIDYFDYIEAESKEGGGNNSRTRTNTFINFFAGLFTKKKEPINFKRNIQYTTSEKFLRLFFPSNLESFDNIEFCNWIFEYLKDSNNFVNPRVLIYFLNELVEAQIDFNQKMKINLQREVAVKNENGCFKFDLFTQDIFPIVYKKVQNDELRNIYKILKSKEYQSIFKEINEKTSTKQLRFNYGDFNIKKMGILKEEFDRLLKYLTLLGYCKEVSKAVYEIPKLYFCKMTLQGNE